MTKEQFYKKVISDEFNGTFTVTFLFARSIFMSASCLFLTLVSHLRNLDEGFGYYIPVLIEYSSVTFVLMILYFIFKKYYEYSYFFGYFLSIAGIYYKLIYSFGFYLVKQRYMLDLNIMGTKINSMIFSDKFFILFITIPLVLFPIVRLLSKKYVTSIETKFINKEQNTYYVDIYSVLPKNSFAIAMSKLDYMWLLIPLGFFLLKNPIKKIILSGSFSIYFYLSYLVYAGILFYMSEYISRFFLLVRHSVTHKVKMYNEWYVKKQRVLLDIEMGKYNDDYREYMKKKKKRN